MNWGKALLLIILVFCTFMIYSIYRINDQVRTDMITQVCADNLESCEHRYIAMQNAKKDNSFKVVKSGPFIVVELPKVKSGKQIKGQILFYCPYNSEYDKKIQIVIDGRNQQIIPASWLHGKTYIVKMVWRDHEEWHYDEKYIFLN